MHEIYVGVWLAAFVLATLLEDASIFMVFGLFILLFAMFGWWGLGVMVLIVFIAMMADC
jgi:hypothetical protein